VEAQVTEVTLVDDLPVILFGHAVHLHGVRLVDQIEQHREALAETDATATAVTDVEHALQLGKQFAFVIELGVFPVQGVPCGCLQTAFSCASHCLAILAAVRPLKRDVLPVAGTGGGACPHQRRPDDQSLS
jgi:hypothetical protein